MVYFACQWLITIVVVWLYDDLTNAGNLALAMNISNFFFAVAHYNIRIFQVSDVKSEYQDREYIVSRVLTSAASFVLCVAFVFISDLTTMQRLIVLFYMLFRVNEAMLDVIHGIAQKHWRMDYIGISLSIRGIAMFVTFVVLGHLFGLLPAIIGMSIITIILGLLYDVPRIKKLISKAAYAGKNIYSLLKRCLPLMLVILIGTALVSYSRYSIERVLDTDALGVYSAVIAPTFAIQVAANMLFPPMANLLTDSLKEGSKAKYIKIFFAGAAIISGATIAFAIASHFLGTWGLTILFRDDIAVYSYLLPGAAIVSGLTAFMWYMNVAFSTTRDIKGLFIGNILGIIICVATIDMFLLRFGLMGANYSMILSQSTVVLSLGFRLFWYINRKPELFAKLH